MVNTVIFLICPINKQNLFSRLLAGKELERWRRVLPGFANEDEKKKKTTERPRIIKENKCQEKWAIKLTVMAVSY